MRALKVLVVLMGVLIVLGLGVIAATIAQRLPGGQGSERFGVQELAVPAGYRVTAATASAHRLIVQLSGPEGVIRLEVLDLRDGSRLGSVLVTEAP